MPSLWFVIVAAMLTAYVILDGFDLGAGIIYLVVTRDSRERRMVLGSIGPVWDGNEVWLIAGGGTLYFVFPRLYASSFSGFYLPLMMVLWLLMLRAIGIEFRTHVDHPVWQEFFDVVFSLASALLAIFFGAALGNVIRGVPLGADGYFFEPLWTNFRPGPHPGILDWYTVMAGVVALVTLTVHGALYVAVKTEGEVSARARSVAVMLWPAQFFLTIAILTATCFVRPSVIDRYREHPIGMLIPFLVAGSLGLIVWAAPKGRERLAFVACGVYIAAMLMGAAFATYPVLLPASTDPDYSLTIYTSAASHHGLAVGLAWWIPGMMLSVGYFVFIYRMFRGKVRLDGGGYGGREPRHSP
jgi:cytochrome bd ubiquinol oxidase subunit II